LLMEITWYGTFLAWEEEPEFLCDLKN
jgi:hypothetical protein